MAVIECGPAVKFEVVNVACALPFSVLEPSVAAPSLKVTEPVGVPAAVEVTLAVNVTDCPTVEGLSNEVIVVVVVARVAGCTTGLSAGEVLPPKLVSPP